MNNSCLSNDDFNRFIYKLLQEGCTMHSVMMLYDNNVIFEKYFAPYNKDSIHRMYSETKSLVSISILFLVQEKVISLNDKLSDYFKEYITKNTHEFLINQTIEDTLLMETSVKCNDWFKDECDDRVKLYFNSEVIKPSGLVWHYDSTSTQVLGELVERVTGLSLLDYLKEKLFNKLGTFKNAYMLKVPSGASWCDSGLMCTLSDMASLATFIMNKGVYNNEQILDSSLIDKATSNLTSNNETGYLNYRANGYGYLFFRMQKNGFAMCGMGNQLTLMFPDSKFVFLCNASDEGNKEHREVLINAVYDLVDKINNTIAEEPIYELRYLPNNMDIDLVNRINKVHYTSVNEQLIKSFELEINHKDGILNFEYNNTIHQIRFGIGSNVFSKLDVDCYSNMIGKIKEDSYHYDIATSACSTSNKQIEIDVQIIDKYLGNLFFIVSFKDNYAWLKVIKHAENYLDGFNFEGLYKKTDC